MKKFLGINDNNVFLLFLAASVIVTGLFFWVIIMHPAGKSVNHHNQAGTAKNVSRVDQSKLEADYKSEVSSTMKVYFDASGNNSLTADVVSQVKGKLLDLKVPTKFKDLHINLIIAMAKMENFYTNGDKTDQAYSEKALSQVKKDYSWLN